MIKKVILLILLSYGCCFGIDRLIVIDGVQYTLNAIEVQACEFLVMAKNSWMVGADQTGWSADQIAEANRQYRIGDIVQVFPDGKLSNYATGNGSFYVIRVVGLSYETALKYQEQWTGVQRRRYRIRAADLPAAVKRQLRDYGYYNTTWTAVRTYIRNMETGLDE